jgi:hypothetical protein
MGSALPDELHHLVLAFLSVEALLPLRVASHCAHAAVDAHIAGVEVLHVTDAQDRHLSTVERLWSLLQLANALQQIVEPVAARVRVLYVAHRWLPPQEQLMDTLPAPIAPPHPILGGVVAATAATDVPDAPDAPVAPPVMALAHYDAEDSFTSALARIGVSTARIIDRNRTTLERLVCPSFLRSPRIMDALVKCPLLTHCSPHIGWPWDGSFVTSLVRSIVQHRGSTAAVSDPLLAPCARIRSLGVLRMRPDRKLGCNALTSEHLHNLLNSDLPLTKIQID